MPFRCYISLLRHNDVKYYLLKLEGIMYLIIFKSFLKSKLRAVICSQFTLLKRFKITNSIKCLSIRTGKNNSFSRCPS